MNRISRRIESRWWENLWMSLKFFCLFLTEKLEKMESLSYKWRILWSNLENKKGSQECKFVCIRFENRGMSLKYRSDTRFMLEEKKNCGSLKSCIIQQLNPATGGWKEKQPAKHHPVWHLKSSNSKCSEFLLLLCKEAARSSKLVAFPPGYHTDGSR